MHTHLLGDKASLSKIRKLIRIDLVQVGARPSIVFDCLVAVTEACGHALRGRPDREGRPSRISWEIDRHEAQFCIEDSSVGSDEGNGHPRRRIHEVIEQETGMRGLGEDVIKQLMDEVTIEETPSAKLVTMTKKIR
ncbi:MAG: ATP-binding protein [Actinomycetota bacterium]|nr:ATP-binding protein [Actinomycetota bacterium]